MMFSLSSVGGSISASGFGPGGPNLVGSKFARTPATVVEFSLVRCTILHYAKPFHATIHHLCVRCTIRHYAEPIYAALHHLCVRCTIRHYAEPFHAALHYLYVRYTILHYAELFHATLHHLCVRCATRNYPVPFDATLHRLCTVLQMSAKLFVVELVHFTISRSNLTWATRPFIIWLDYSCLGCSVS